VDPVDPEHYQKGNPLSPKNRYYPKIKFYCVRFYRYLHTTLSDAYKKNSCSKCLTMAVLARLWEEGRVELDQSVSHYLPTWPDKLVDGQPVSITLRQLCSHLGGIRYEYEYHIAESC
jgi:hypothetical protein